MKKRNFLLIILLILIIAITGCSTQDTSTSNNNKNLSKEDYNAIRDFLSQNPSMGEYAYYEEASPWAKGKRYSVSTKEDTYLFYLHKNNVVGVYINGPDGILSQIYHEDIPELPDNIERAATETLPEYIIIDQMDLLSGGRYGDILVESYSTDTPMNVREKTLRAIMGKENFTEASLYCTREAYKANMSSSYSESHPQALKEGYLGMVWDDGKFYEPIN